MFDVPNQCAPFKMYHSSLQTPSHQSVWYSVDVFTLINGGDDTDIDNDDDDNDDNDNDDNDNDDNVITKMMIMNDQSLYQDDQSGNGGGGGESYTYYPTAGDSK